MTSQPISATNFFSPNYQVARQRFIDTATAAGADMFAYPVAAELPDDLFIDVALVGAQTPSSVMVISSGLHGVEGFFGSAVQTAWLDALAKGHHPALPDEWRVVLIHALNPFGFDQCRRVNEDNIDLNRNFLGSNKDFTGAPGSYLDLDPLLNPPSTPTGFDPFILRALWHVLRLGFGAFKEAVAGGQYTFERGLFYGGKGPAASHKIIEHYLAHWLGDATNIVHLDFHTGLGAYGEYRLLLSETDQSRHFPWYLDTFDKTLVEPLTDNQAQGTAYTTSGVLGEWLGEQLTGRDYRFANAEFGTYPVMRMLKALRQENRAHFFADPNSKAYAQAKAELTECFCPRDPKWRTQVLSQGLQLIEQALVGLQAR